MDFEERIRSLPKRTDVDAIVAMSPENFAYISQAYIITVEMIRPRQAFAIVPREGEPVVLICSIEESLTREESWIEDIRTYTEYVDYPVDSLASVLRDMGLDKGKVGMDLQYLPQVDWVRLTEILPDLEIIDTTEEVAKLRAIKTDKEIAMLEFATKSTHRAAQEALSESSLGESEKVMANRMLFKMIEKGADGSFFMVFGSGPRSAFTHGFPSDRIPKESEVIRFDYGGRYGMWTSDFARTYSTGNPTEIQRRAYRNLKEIQAETISVIRPGIKAEDVFYACKSAFEKRNIPFFMPHVGHSFGVELHEHPMMRPGDTTVIEKGMVINIEPVLKDEDGSMYHLEDLVEVTDDGHRVLTLGLPPIEIPVIGEPVKAE